MNKQNCWDFKRCGRGPAGKNDCAAAKDRVFNGIHGGLNAGRACWVVAGSCGIGAASGTFAKQLKDCLRCDFFALVRKDEEGSHAGFFATRLGMVRLIQAAKTGQSVPGPAPKDAGRGSAPDHIDKDLRAEFAAQVNTMTTAPNNGNGSINDEFAREVDRLAAGLKDKERK